MPIDTAVPAITNDTASVIVASNSIAALRRRENLRSVIGDAKPTFPVSSVMARHPFRVSFRLRRIPLSESPLGESVCGACNVAPDLGKAVEE
jgi:hypothetical protein